MKGQVWGYLSFLVLILFFLTGCQTTEAAMKQSSDDSEGKQNLEEELITVGFSQVGSESDWRIANTESMKTSFSEENGYELIFDDAQQKQENQIRAIRNFIEQEVDYIVLAPVTETGWDSVLQEAKEAEIPVIIVDRRVDSDESLYTAWVGSDFLQEGYVAADWLNAYLEAQGRSEETIYMVTIQGTIGASAQIGRTNGIAERMKEHPNWIMMERLPGDYTEAKAREVMKYYLEQYSEIDVVICENDNEAFGAIDAIKAAGKTSGENGEIIVISFDAVSAAFDAMIQGDLNLSVECNPLHGPRVAEIIQKLERGEMVEKTQYVMESYFDSSMDLIKIKEERLY